MNTKQKGLRFGRIGLLPALTLPAMAMAALCATSLPALAQAAAEPADATGQPAGQLRFFVDLKDATLADALEMVFKAAGNPAHIIDDSAKSVNISSTTFPNHDWSSIVRNLTSAYNFKFYKNEGGTWVVEPRFPQQFMNNIGGEGGEFGSGSSSGRGRGRGGQGGFGGQQGGFGGGQGGQQGGFGGAQGGNRGGFGRQGGFGGGNRPEVRNFANQQTLPAFGGGAAAAASGEEKSFRVLTVKHIPARGVAYLFQDTEVIPTEIFVMPAGGGMGGGMGGMGGGMMGGMGGGMGGMGGGMMGGMGGGMMGGMGGGMGGMGGGMMGGMGGMGGGMMGGMGGGMGGMGGGGFGGFGR